MSKLEKITESKLNTNSPEFKALRANVMAISVKKHGWSYEEFHELMKEWGYGSSLRELDWFHLNKLRRELLGATSYNGFAKFDPDGMHMWSIAITAWPKDTMKRLQLFWIKKYHKSHWNILNAQERRATKKMLKNYI